MYIIFQNLWGKFTFYCKIFNLVFDKYEINIFNKFIYGNVWIDIGTVWKKKKFIFLIFIYFGAIKTISKRIYFFIIQLFEIILKTFQ